MISTDAEGRIAFMNPIAEAMKWSIDDARNRPLSEVFRIVNEATRAVSAAGGGPDHGGPIVASRLSSAAMLARLRKYLRRRKYTAGKRLTQFLAPDVRRDVEIAVVPEFEAPRRVAITDLWTRTGQPWGGPIPSDDISRG